MEDGSMNNRGRWGRGRSPSMKATGTAERLRSGLARAQISSGLLSTHASLPLPPLEGTAGQILDGVDAGGATAAALGGRVACRRPVTVELAQRGEGKSQVSDADAQRARMLWIWCRAVVQWHGVELQLGLRGSVVRPGKEECRHAAGKTDLICIGCGGVHGAHRPFRCLVTTWIHGGSWL
ncbi:hypothetical protein CFC21_095024 [Triticum aestivum]|uniref:Uncharacterized protein n=3 Tax=Triticum TaxID=4564 RepID=A0A3B6RA50_WHEAT|nr:hypothetical protein TRIUR3_14757 [Triticum urartu]KAF7092547.1 hypothetical protein CFC21_095024 [Triticum aestivum]